MGASPCGFKSRSRHQRGPGRQPAGSTPGGTGHIRGDVAKWTKAEVCKTSIRRFESARRLHPILSRCRIYFPLCCLYPLPTLAETPPDGLPAWRNGRRGGLKIRYLFRCVGSNPSAGTIFPQRSSHPSLPRRDKAIASGNCPSPLTVFPTRPPPPFPRKRESRPGLPSIPPAAPTVIPA